MVAHRLFVFSPPPRGISSVLFSSRFFAHSSENASSPSPTLPCFSLCVCVCLCLRFSLPPFTTQCFWPFLANVHVSVYPARFAVCLALSLVFPLFFTRQNKSRFVEIEASCPVGRGWWSAQFQVRDASSSHNPLFLCFLALLANQRRCRGGGAFSFHRQQKDE